MRTYWVTPTMVRLRIQAVGLARRLRRRSLLPHLLLHLLQNLPEEGKA